MTQSDLELLQAWQEKAAELDRMRTPCADDPTAGIVAQEMELRRMLADRMFAAPAEGANEVEIAAGFVLRLTYKLARKIDWEGLQAARGALAELGISLDGLIEMQPSLRLSVYRSLPETARRIVDNSLTITPQAPTLAVVKKG